jgi:hypothetical protein
VAPSAALRANAIGTPSLNPPSTSRSSRPLTHCDRGGNTMGTAALAFTAAATVTPCDSAVEKYQGVRVRVS